MWLFNISKLLDMEFEQSVQKMIDMVKRIVLGAIIIITIEITASWYWSIENIRDIIQTTIGAFAFISFYIAILNLCLNRIHKKTSIDIEMKHRAIDLLMKWSMENTPEIVMSKKIVERMDKKEIIKLAKGNEKVVISRIDYSMLRSFMPEKFLKIQKSYFQKREILKAMLRERGKRVDLDNDEIELSLEETIWLRVNVVKYVNILEVIMYAWAAGAVSREIIETELRYLVTPERDGNVVLEEFRTAVGKENFPGINIFCQEMNEKSKKEIMKMKLRV